MAADQSGWFRKSVALKLYVEEEDHQRLVAWAISAGPYLGHKGNLSVEPTWKVVVACCSSEHSPVDELHFQYTDTRVLVI